MMKRLVTVALAVCLLAGCKGKTDSGRTETSAPLETTETTTVQTAETTTVQTTSAAAEDSLAPDDSSQTDEEAEEQMSWKLFEELYQKLPADDRSVRNYQRNQSVGIEGFIEYGQANAPVCDLVLGDVSFSGVGCEVIAAYNYLLYTGGGRDMAKLAFDFEQNAMFDKSGKLGSNPRKIRGLFDALGIAYDRYLDPDDCRKAIEAGKPVILSFHTGRNVFSPLHTVFIMTEDGEHYVFNRYNESEGRYGFETLEDIIGNDALFIVAYTTASEV